MRTTTGTLTAAAIGAVALATAASLIVVTTGAAVDRSGTTTGSVVAIGPAAATVSSAARGLVPAIDRANRDQAAYLATGCNAPVDRSTATACVVGDRTARRTILLMGDSHAANWAPGLTRAAEVRGYRLIIVTKSACPVQDVPSALGRGSTTTAYPQCVLWRRNAMRYATWLRPALVVVAGSHTGRWLGRGRAPVPPGETPIETRSRLWRTGTEVVLRQFAARSPATRVLVVADVPVARSNILACLRESPRIEDCAMPRDEALRENMRTAEVAALAVNPRARVLDPAEEFCDDHACYAAGAGILRYRDPGHLTATYARSRGDIWLRVIDSLARPLPAGAVVLAGPRPRPPGID